MCKIFCKENSAGVLINAIGRDFFVVFLTKIFFHIEDVL